MRTRIVKEERENSKMCIVENSSYLYSLDDIVVLRAGIHCMCEQEELSNCRLVLVYMLFYSCLA